MKKTYSNKTIALIIFISFLSGSVPAYASTFSGEDITTYLKAIFNISASGFSQNIDQKSNDEREQSQSILKEHISSSTNQVIDNVDRHLQQEEERFHLEITDYTSDLTDDLDNMMNSEEQRLKQIVTDYVNDKINYTKEQLQNDLKTELHKHLLELTQ